MNKCEKCGFLHYRTDPCRVAKKSTAAGKVSPNQKALGQSALNAEGAGTQALPVDTNSSESDRLVLSDADSSITSSAGTDGSADRQPKPRGRPRIHPDRRAYKAEHERNRRAEIKSGIRKTEGEEMSEWEDMASAPKDGTEVKAGHTSKYFPGGVAYPLTAKFKDGEWCADFGGNDWSPYSPQPDVWQPIQKPTIE